MHNGILCSLTRRWTVDFCYNVDRVRENRVKLSKSEGGKYQIFSFQWGDRETKLENRKYHMITNAWMLAAKLSLPGDEGRRFGVGEEEKIKNGLSTAMEGLWHFDGG